jgi:PSP1-like protein
LTFYFYAEQYINFNDLVTELFKIWKLRIWLSAVNPASYPEQKTRGRGHRLRSEGGLAASQSPVSPEGPEGPFQYQGFSPGTTNAMGYNTYMNVGMPSYGNPFGSGNTAAPTNANNYIQNQPGGMGNAYAPNTESSMMSTYFGGPAPPSGMGNQQHWNTFANPGAGDYSGPEAGHVGQSLAGFGGATPFVPGRVSSYGTGSPEPLRNFSGRGGGRAGSIGNNQTDDSNGELSDYVSNEVVYNILITSLDPRRRQYRPTFGAMPNTTRGQGPMQINAWPTFGQHAAPPGLNASNTDTHSVQLPRGNPWSFGDFPSSGASGSNAPAPGGHAHARAMNETFTQFGGLNLRDENDK